MECAGSVVFRLRNYSIIFKFVTFITLLLEQGFSNLAGIPLNETAISVFQLFFFKAEMGKLDFFFINCAYQ